MKKIYFVLTYTGTILSRIVHIYTGQEFCHSSLSLDAELNEMVKEVRKKNNDAYSFRLG